ncbi:19916_t:CDS:2 [Funneliformis geosporum]|nr:19916_t:CDS:2 [Funneliformis geosporum]
MIACIRHNSLVGGSEKYFEIFFISPGVKGCSDDRYDHEFYKVADQLATINIDGKSIYGCISLNKADDSFVRFYNNKQIVCKYFLRCEYSLLICHEEEIITRTPELRAWNGYQANKSSNSPKNLQSSKRQHFYECQLENNSSGIEIILNMFVYKEIVKEESLTKENIVEAFMAADYFNFQTKILLLEKELQ